ncbi:hypothetical protein [Streptomyces sp. NPDC102360]|uniref:hypothetical protein n=1 Tax=Streptomyces sp. NPDC102360 TaxID=3366160 RepID=UPI0038165772
MRSLLLLEDAAAEALQRWHRQIGSMLDVNGGPPSPVYKVRGAVRVPSAWIV